MTKCAHDLCMNNAVEGSDYCEECVQLPTKECNFCNVLGTRSDNRVIADRIAERNARIRYWISGYGAILFILILWFIFLAFMIGWIQ